jgi:ubiquinone/menaquinone biosynthesis C-methylase UbiE
MTDADAATGQVTADAAEIYERCFVPALFAQWPDRVLDHAGLVDGDAVLDVACGTGVVARAAARRLRGTGSVTGLDVNEGMLAVARRSPAAVSWRRGAAEELPFPDASFDRAVCQFGLMFFVDRVAALREMCRVVRAGGTVTVATWAGVDESPGYAAMVDLLRRLFGGAAAGALLAPFSIGTSEALRALMAAAGAAEVTVTHVRGEARFDGLDAWLSTEIRGWALAEQISDAQFAQLSLAARRELAHLVGADGRVCFDAPALVATATVGAT